MSSNAEVLVVEDDDLIREGIREVLEAEGYTTEGAANGEEALFYLEGATTLPKLVLLDLRMPILDGWGLVNRLRQNSAFALLPLAIMSAHFGPIGPSEPNMPERPPGGRKVPLLSKP